jgi:serine/threonine protein kinase
MLRSKPIQNRSGRFRNNVAQAFPKIAILTLPWELKYGVELTLIERAKGKAWVKKEVIVTRQHQMLVEGIKNEIKVLGHLHRNKHHPNIVRYMGWSNARLGASFGHKPTVSIFTEYIPGASTPPTRKNVPDFIKVFKQALSAVQFIHMNGVLHRDIKPMNFVYDASRSRIVLLDFDTACMTGSYLSTTSCSRVRDTGTPHFKEPQLFRQGKRAVMDRRSDIYSLGVTFYTFYHGNSEKSLANYTYIPKNRNLTYQSIVDQWIQSVQKAGSAIEVLLLWMMSPRPNDRPGVGQIERYLKRMEAGTINVKQEKGRLQEIVYQLLVQMMASKIKQRSQKR